MKTVFLHAFLAGACLLLPGSIPAQVVVSGTGLGEIPDGGPNGPADWGSPLQVSFNVSGVTAPIADISLSITIQHGFVGDVETVLRRPGQTAGFVIFSRVGQPDGPKGGGSPTTFSADLDGNIPATYVFSDKASGNLWTTAGFNTTTGTSDFTGLGNILPGGYRTSAAGPWDALTNPNAGQVTSFATDSGFVGLTPAQANGTWILEFRDGLQDDTGVVTDAALSITPVPESAWYTMLTGVALAAFASYRVRRHNALA